MAGIPPGETSEGPSNEELDHPEPGGRHAGDRDHRRLHRAGIRHVKGDPECRSHSGCLETVGGSNYAKYKALYPSSLNWTNDGCSVPNKVLVAGGLGVVLKVYGGVFGHSCDRHDFGYRNFGSATSTPGTHPKFSPTRATKNKIDSRFYSNMKVQCDDKFGGVVKAPLRVACKAAAKTFYEAVSHFADDAFFA